MQQKQRHRNTIFLLSLVIIILLAVLGRMWVGGREENGPPIPTAQPTPVVRFEGIRAIAELATVEYLTVAEVQNEQVPDDIRKWVGAKEQILMLVYGNVKAGFDLSELSEDALWTDRNRVQLTLPAPKILSISVDNKRTHVVYYKKSLIIKHDPNIEGETRRIADEAIRQGAIEAGIFKQAEISGKMYFENYLRSLGFTYVQVVVK